MPAAGHCIALPTAALSPGGLQTADVMPCSSSGHRFFVQDFTPVPNLTPADRPPPLSPRPGPDPIPSLLALLPTPDPVSLGARSCLCPLPWAILPRVSPLAPPSPTPALGITQDLRAEADTTRALDVLSPTLLRGPAMAPVPRRPKSSPAVTVPHCKAHPTTPASLPTSTSLSWAGDHTSLHM